MRGRGPWTARTRRRSARNCGRWRIVIGSPAADEQEALAEQLEARREELLRLLGEKD
jgi:hypothetical protein